MRVEDLTLVLAARVHDGWAEWMNHMWNAHGDFMDDGSWVMRPQHVKNLMGQSSTRFSIESSSDAKIRKCRNNGTGAGVGLTNAERGSAIQDAAELVAMLVDLQVLTVDVPEELLLRKPQ